MVDAQPLVTITGVTGFLGSQIAAVFLKDGKYQVRGTVRSKTNAAKIDPLKAGLGDLFDKMELVEADMLDEATVLKACEGATYVIHPASPFAPQLPEDELVKPAVAGTTAVMKACAQHKVKRCVITSSTMAMCATDKADMPPEGQKWNETYWSDPERPKGQNDFYEQMQAYANSKTKGEKTAWDFQANQPENERFEIATINPCFIMGPSICSGDGTSEGFMTAMVNGSMPTIPNTTSPFCDVRDVALAHLKAIQI